MKPHISQRGTSFVGTDFPRRRLSEEVAKLEMQGRGLKPTMSISAELIKLVPEGEANAVSGRVLWQQLGMWSPFSVKHALKKMAAAGEIERKDVPHPTGGIGVYFKQALRPQ